MRNPFNSPLWKNTAFVRVWGAATISIFGSLVTRIALPLAAILVLGAGAFEVAILRGLEIGAALVVGLVAGAWVDRLRRRPVLIWADIGRAALLASIPIAFAFGVLTLWQLFAVSGLAAILTAFFDAADNAYLPTIVERERLVDANGALAASGSASEFMAFGISGFLVQLLSAPLAILIDALSFLGSALLLGSIKHDEEPPPPKADREPVLSEIRDGLRLVIHDPVLRAFAGAQMALSALWGILAPPGSCSSSMSSDSSRGCSGSSPASVASRRSLGRSWRLGRPGAGASGRSRSGRWSCRPSAMPSSRWLRPVSRSWRSAAS